MAIADLRAALRGRLVHGDLTHYNAVQKLLYFGALSLIVLAIVSGLAIWKPVQLSWLIAIWAASRGGRIIHFIAMSGLVLFPSRACGDGAVSAAHHTRDDPWKVTSHAQASSLAIRWNRQAAESSRMPRGLMHANSRRKFLRTRSELRRTRHVDRLRSPDRQFHRNHATRRVALQRSGVQAWLFDPGRLAQTFSESDITRPFPFNAFYPRLEAPEVEASRLPARCRRPCGEARRVEVSMNSTACRVKARSPGISASKAGVRSANGPVRHLRIFSVRRRRQSGEIRAVPMRRRLFDKPRHGKRAPSANADDVRIRRRTLATRLWLSDEDPRADQARLQESEACRRARRQQRLHRRFLGTYGYNWFSGL